MGRKPKKTVESAEQAEILQWKDFDGKAKFLASYNASMEEALKEVKPIFRSLNSSTYQNVYSPSISIRDEFNRSDYDIYRPSEAIPTDPKGKIQACLAAYEKSGYGIVKNIVDLMSDFTVQGIDVAYPDKNKENLLKFWFHRIVNGPERSKRFANLACKVSNIFIKRVTAKVPLNIVRKMERIEAKADSVYEESQVVEKREMPVDYKFLHPLSVDPIAPELSMFLNSKQRRYGLRVSSEVLRRIQHPSSPVEQELIDQLPIDIVNSIRSGNTVIPLDPTKLSAYYYNKEDWDVWATPMIYTVLADLRHLEKLKLADLAALDGAISQIRIWKLGDVKNGLKVSAAAMNNLSQILMNAVGGGFLDLVWTEDLQFQEVGSNLHNFLGDGKYATTLNAIYTGLGIPPLFGGGSGQGNFTNNFIAIKVMIERLESLRNLLREFWRHEFELVAKAFELDQNISLTFDRMTLNDESSILQIMLHLVDRGYLSIEGIQEMVGANPEIEKFRTNREWKEQENGERPPKASPFHKPEWDKTWMDSFIKLGELAPSQVGLDIEQKKDGEIVPAARPNQIKKNPNDLGGRPKGKKDSTKRKQKEVKPRRSVSKLIQMTAWASDALGKISDHLTPIYLKSNAKKNLRQLTDKQFGELETHKFKLLSMLSPFTPINTEVLKENEGRIEGAEIPEKMNLLLSEMISQYSKNNELTVDKRREFQAIVYAAYNL